MLTASESKAPEEEVLSFDELKRVAKGKGLAQTMTRGNVPLDTKAARFGTLISSIPFLQ
jgi:hypothetical protein